MSIKITEVTTPQQVYNAIKPLEDYLGVKITLGETTENGNNRLSITQNGIEIFYGLCQYANVYGLDGIRVFAEDKANENTGNVGPCVLIKDYENVDLWCLNNSSYVEHIRCFAITNVITTSKGFAFMDKTNGSPRFFCGKTHGGGIGFLGHTSRNAIMNTLYTAVTYDGLIAPPTEASLANISIDSTVTSMANALIAQGEDYFDDIYYIIGCESSAVGKYVIDGQQYYSSGILALMD